MGLKKEKHINMSHIRNKFQIMSVNQICIYHTILEAYNIMRNGASEQIQMKWTNTRENNYSLRRITLEYGIRVPVRLLIFKISSHRYTLISDGTIINFQIYIFCQNSKEKWTLRKIKV